MSAAAFRFGIVRFPGTNCEQDVKYALDALGYDSTYIWHQDTDISSYDAIILPGGFSYGDYLRAGAIARHSPVMGAVIDYATSGRPVMGICNGFQILTEAHLLPGALIRNRDLKFICEDVPLYVEDSICKWVPPDTRRGIGDGAVPAIIHVPINHNEGNYYCDDETLRKLKANKQVVLRYAGANGAPNGALDDIAGICNEAGNVFGLMPHPERVVDGLAGYDGRMLFSGIVAGMVKEATA